MSSLPLHVIKYPFINYGILRTEPDPQGTHPPMTIPTKIPSEDMIKTISKRSRLRSLKRIKLKKLSRGVENHLYPAKMTPLFSCRGKFQGPNLISHLLRALGHLEQNQDFFSLSTCFFFNHSFGADVI